MSPAQSILLFIFVSNGIVSLSVFFTNPKRSQNRLFLLFSSSLTLWVLFVLGIIDSNTPFMAKAGIKGASIAGAFIPVTFYLFCQAIANPTLSFGQLFKKSKLALSLSLIISIMCLTSFFLKGVTLPDNDNNLLVPEAHYGPGFVIFIAFFPVIIYRTIYVFYQTLRNSTGMARAEMQFTLIGMTSALPIAVLIHVVAIISGSSQPQQYGPLCIIPINLVIAYGIATRRILGIEKVLRQAIAYVLLASFLALIYFIAWLVADYAMSGMMKNRMLLSQIFATIVALLILSPAQQHILAATSKFITGNSINVTDVMKEASIVFQSVSTITSLHSHFSKMIEDAFHPKSLTILEGRNSCFQQQHPPTSGIRPTEIDLDNPILQMLASTKDTICRESLSRVKETVEKKKVKKEMDRLGITLAAGIFSKGTLSGLLAMGEKKGGGIYDKVEQDTLQTLCNQFAVALENAQLYTEVQDSKIRNEIMLDQLASGVVVANPDREITLFNHEAQRITGIEERNAMGKSIDILPGSIRTALDTTLEKKAGARNLDTALFASDNEENVSVRMASAFLYGHDDKPMGALLVFTDTTELKSLEEQVRRTDQLSSVGTLAAGMAHEIKNPLVTIKTFTQLLPQRYPDDDFRKEFSELVSHEVSRIDGIVNELLSFSKPAKPHLVPMKLHDTIEQTLKLTHEQMAQKDIKVKSSLKAARELISGDAKLLSQALVNLHLNAIEAIEDGGSISVGTSNCKYRFADNENPSQVIEKQCIRVQISDTGEGIPQADLQKIFDPFFTSKSKGTGMGLSVAHGIIREHNGVVEVESEVGRGTSFHVYIPVIEEGASE